MEGASGSGDPGNINQQIVSNTLSRTLFDVLHGASKNKLEQMKELLNIVGVDVNFSDKNEGSNTLLHGATSNGYVEIVRLLLERGAEVNVKNAGGDTPLHNAVARGPVEIVRLLLERGAEVNVKNAEGDTPLHIAVARDSVDIVKLLLYKMNTDGSKQKVDVNIKNANGDTPLHIAVRQNTVAMIQMLLGKKNADGIKQEADVNIQNEKGDTPLHIAVAKCEVGIVDLFLNKKKKANSSKQKVDDNIKNAVSGTTLPIADGSKQRFDVNIQNENGDTPLHIAVRQNSVRITQMLLDKKNADSKQEADVNIKNKKGETPLHLVFSKSSNDIKELYEMLVNHGADVNIENCDGKTPLELKEETINTGNSNKKSGTYEPSGGKLNSHGMRYQLYLLLLFALRALKKGYTFTLGSEVKEADKFDDLVFNYDCLETGESKTIFLQAKSKLTVENEISLGALIAEGKNAPFSLLKYFKSYIKICKQEQEFGTRKEQVQKFGFIICTNTKFAFESSGGNILTGNDKKLSFKEDEHILGELISKEVQCFQLVGDDEQTFGWLKKDLTKQLKNEMKLDQGFVWLKQVFLWLQKIFVWLKNVFTQNSKKEIKTEPAALVQTTSNTKQKKQDVINGKGKDEVNMNYILKCFDDSELWNFRIFLKNVRFVVGLPEDYEQFNNEFGEYSKTNKLCPNTDVYTTYTNAFRCQMFDWLTESEGKWLSNETLKKMIERTCSNVSTSTTQIFVEKYEKMPYEFELRKLKDLNQLISERKIVHLITPVKTELALLQVAQAIKKFNGSSGFIYIDVSSLLLSATQERTIRAFDSPVNNDWLVIDCLSEEESLTPTELEALQRKLLEITKKKTKKLIIVAPKKHCFAQMFTKEHGLCSYQVETSFLDFTEETQGKMLEKEVTFQGQTMKLNQIIDKREVELLNIVPIETLIGQNGLVVGSQLTTSKGYDESYYIYRYLTYQTVINANIFEDKSSGRFKDEIAKNEDDIEELYSKNENSNIHLIEKKEDKYIWVKSKGSLSGLHPYIDNRNTPDCTKKEKEFLDFIAEKTQNVGPIIISDEPGMGKSTVLDNISKEIKAKHQGTLILRINLIEHTKVLNELMEKTRRDEINYFNHKSAMELLRKLLIITTPLEEELLKQDGKSVVMFDGFDEICSDFEKIVLNWIHNLKKATKAQIWITTRPFKREVLENYFRMFSYNLQPLSPENKLEFLVKFWQYWEINENSDDSILRVRASSLIDKWSASISDKEMKFTGIPLQLRMLAECFVPDCEKTEDMERRLTLVRLYEKFIEKKIFYLEILKMGIDSSKPGSSPSFIKHERMNIHNWYALLEIISKNKAELLFPENKRKRYKSVNYREIDSEINRFGIASIIDGVPSFTHRTFAEYLVAVFLMKYLRDMNNIKEEVKIFILSDLLVKDKYTVIRIFLNGLFENMSSSEELSLKKPFSEDLVKNKTEHFENRSSSEEWSSIEPFSEDLVKYKTEHFENIFLQTAKEGNIHILSYLLHCVKTDLQKFLQCTEFNTKKTMLHLAARNDHIIFVVKFLNEASVRMDNGTFKNMLLSTDYKHQTLLHSVGSYCGNTGEVEKLLEWIFVNVGPACVKEMLLGNTFSPLILATYRCGEKMLKTLLQWALVKLGKEFVKELLCPTYGTKILQWFCRNAGSCLAIQLLQWLFDEMGPVFVKTLLLSADEDFHTPLLLVIRQYDKRTLKELLQWTHDKMGQTCMEEMFLSTDMGGCTALMLVSSLRPKMSKMFVHYMRGNTIQDQEIVKQYLFPALQVAFLKYGTYYYVCVLLKWIRENVYQDNDTLYHMLIMTNNNGDTALLTASMHGIIDAVKTLLQWTRENIDQHKETMKQMLVKRNNDGNTALLAASMHGKIDVVQTLLEWTLENMDEETLTELKAERNNNV